IMDEKKTSKPSWNRQLKLKLDFLKESKRNKNTNPTPDAALKGAMVGVGSEINGDDAAGLWVVRGLLRTLKDSPHCLCIEGGVVPENALGPLRKFDPDWVILVDAADFEATPGSIRLVDQAEIDGFSFSSHTLPLGMICTYLGKELGCPVWLLGLQPVSLEFGEPLTDPVQRAVDEIIVKLAKLTR
ncbi:hydrogenase 3 maturation endopeptidase HyCI, partial [bacterium]|nr:hydrogenase 3 maturation endopeptidase HyCI [bacterium]